MENNDILRISWFLLNLNEKGRYTAFFDYSGHVKTLCVRIYKGKWNRKKNPIYYKYLNVRGGKLIETEGYNVFDTSVFVEYVKELK